MKLLPEEDAAIRMSEFLRKYWFVCLLGLSFTGVLIYYIIDMNKDNVSPMKADGQEVVAATSLGNVTSTDLFDRAAASSQSTLFNMYRNAVVDQSIETDSEMKSEAKTMARNLKGNMNADASGKSKYSTLAQLAAFGFTGEDAPYNYALTSLKVQKLNQQFVSQNFEALKDKAPKGARTISVITMSVPNDKILSESATQKQKDIQAALDAGKSFGEVAAQFSEDEATKDKNGFFGYIDSNSKALNEAIVSKATAMKPGEISDWISVQPDKDNKMFTLYRIYVNETDPAKLINSEEKKVAADMVNSMVSSINNLEVAAVADAAKKLDITFENEEVKNKVESYIADNTADFKNLLDKAKADQSKASSETSKASSQEGTKNE